METTPHILRRIHTTILCPLCNKETSGTQYAYHSQLICEDCYIEVINPNKSDIDNGGV